MSMDFQELVWWLQKEYDWDFVKSESVNRVRFDWNSGITSFWLNDDLTGDGYIPEEIRKDITIKGIKLNN